VVDSQRARIGDLIGSDESRKMLSVYNNYRNSAARPTMLQIEGFNIKRGRGDGASLHREMVSIFNHHHPVRLILKQCFCWRLEFISLGL
jgi:hypothetical protein